MLVDNLSGQFQDQKRADTDWMRLDIASQYKHIDDELQFGTFNQLRIISQLKFVRYELDDTM